MRIGRRLIAGSSIGPLWPRALAHLFLVVLGVVYALPFYWLIVSSIKDASELYRYPPTFWPQTFTTGHYERLVEVIDIRRIYWNTLKITATIVVVTLSLSSAAAYCFEKLRFFGRELLFSAIILTMIVPFQAQMVPLYLVMDSLNLVNTHAAVILPFLASGFAVFFFRQNMRAVPDDLIDAATIDGVSVPGRFFRVVLPLMTTAMATVAILTFVAAWTEFLWPFIMLNSGRLATIEVAMAIFTNSLEDREEGVRMAGAAVAIVPMMIFFVFAQRYFIRGVALTGLK